jgi:predicted MPP superfamily phosphohydrolase
MVEKFLTALVRALVRPPFVDEAGSKGWLDRLSRALPHAVRRLRLTIAGWPCWSRPLRIAFLSDFHTGSHAYDVARLRGIIADAAAYRPDLVLYGGDFVNMQLFGGGRVPPSTIAIVLGELRAPLGAFAVLGNHDYTYGEHEVLAALRAADIVPLDDERHQLSFEGAPIDLIGVPDFHVKRPRAKALLASLSVSRPTIVLAHDPASFKDLAKGPHIMLAGHTHGGQICVPGIGPVVNMSRAPLRHTFGLIQEDSRQMYVTSGIGTSGVPIRIGVPPEIVLLEVTGRP